MDLYFDVRQHSKNNKCIYDYLMINVTSDKNSTHKLED